MARFVTNFRFLILAGFALLVVVGLAFGVMTGAVAADKKQESSVSGLKVAVVDVQVLLKESKAAKNIQEQLESRRKQFQDEIAKQESALRAEGEKLGKQQGDAAKSEEFAKKKAAFEKDLAEMRQLVQKRRRALEKSSGEAVLELRKQISAVVAELSDENHYDLVLTQQNVILASKSMDITAEVMEKLNDKVKKIEVKVDTN